MGSNFNLILDLDSGFLEVLRFLFPLMSSEKTEKTEEGNWKNTEEFN